MIAIGASNIHQFNSDHTLALRLLKVRIKALSSEALILRQEEDKNQGSVQRELSLQRILGVRQAARQTQLAYAFLRKKPYSSVEEKGSHSKPIDWGKLWLEIEGVFLRASKKEFRFWKLRALLYRQDVRHYPDLISLRNLLILHLREAKESRDFSVLAGLWDSLRSFKEKLLESEEDTSLLSDIQEIIADIQTELEGA